LFPKLKFGQFASAAGIVGSLGSIGLGLILGPILDLTGNYYRLTFIMGLVLCLASIVLLYMVYTRFMALGGPKHYVAPEPIPHPAIGDPAILPGAESNRT